MNLNLMSSVNASQELTDTKGQPFMLDDEEIKVLDKVSPIKFSEITLAPELKSSQFCINCKFYNSTKVRVSEKFKMSVSGECRVVHPPFAAVASLEWCGEWKEIPVDPVPDPVIVPSPVVTVDQAP